MEILHKLEMDLEIKAPTLWLEIPQGDVNTRKIRFLLTANGLPWTLPENAAVVISFRKPDGTEGAYDTLPNGTQAWESVGDTLTIALAPQVLSCPGAVMLYASIRKEEKVLSTFGVEIRVRMMDEDGKENRIDRSEDYFYITQILPGPVMAQVGQYLCVEAVDTYGKVTRVKAVDATESASMEIPKYWETELHAGVEQIRTVLENAGQNKAAFLWYHDAHWTNNAGISPKLMKYLCDHTAIDKVNFGGDIVSTETAENREDWAYLYHWQDAVRDLPNHHSVRGNHDDDIPGLQTDKAIYAFLMGGEKQEKVVRGGDFFYYMDDASEKTRYLYLDTHMCTTLTNQGNPDEVQFVLDALHSTPKNWHIVPVAHIWFLYADWNTPTAGEIPTYCKQLLDIFDAYNARRKGNVTVNGVQISYDFSGGLAKVEFCMGGHTHVDMDLTSTGGIPVILTEADCYEWRSGYDATPGTIGEAAVTAVIANYDEKKVHVIRIGRGESREVSLNQSVTDYTNILDEVGYVANKRLSQSGGYSETNEPGVYLTGYIQVNTGDTLYFKNMILTETYNTGYDQHLYIFDGDKIGQGHGHISDYDGDAGVVATEYEVDENGVRHFTQMTYLGAPGYIRINAVYIDSNSIITINENIY